MRRLQQCLGRSERPPFAVPAFIEFFYLIKSKYPGPPSQCCAFDCSSYVFSRARRAYCRGASRISFQNRTERIRPGSTDLAVRKALHWQRTNDTDNNPRCHWALLLSAGLLALRWPKRCQLISQTRNNSFPAQERFAHLAASSQPIIHLLVEHATTIAESSWICTVAKHVLRLEVKLEICK